MYPQLEELFTHQCKIFTDYYFDKCCNKTCKNYSAKIDSRCMVVERAECLNSERGISDQEIRFYKNYPSIKQVVRSRKLAHTRVYSILILDKYLEYITNLVPKKISPSALEDEKVKNILNSYPLNIKEFKITHQVLPHLFDVETFNSFSKKECKTCNEYYLHDILGIDEPSLSELADVIKFY